MKRVFSILLTMLLLACFSACSGNTSVQPSDAPTSSPVSSETPVESAAPVENGEQSAQSNEPAETVVSEGGTEAEGASRILVAYFSKTGNTEAVANMIAEETGGTLFKIETVTPYPEDYDETVDIAREEQDNNARPELSTHVENMDDYDVIYLGYPNWWGTMPQAMFTFLEEYDFSGKTIAPFCTHGGSALGRSEGDISALCPEANLLPGFAVSGSRARDAQPDVTEWLSGLDIA